MVAQKNNNYVLYISSQSDFSSFSKYNSSENYNLTLNGQKLLFSENNGIQSSEGNIVILNKKTQEYGCNMTGFEKNVVVFDRFVRLNGNIARISLWVW